MTEDLLPVWINGTPDADIPATDRGLAYGDGVFETLRLQPQPVLSDFHWDRLEKGLRVLGIPCDFNYLKQEAQRYAACYSPQVLKVIVTRGSGGRGYQPPEVPQPLNIIQGFSLPDYPKAWYETGVSLYLCQTVLSCHPQLSGIKHLNRLEQVLGRQEFAGTDFQEGLMGNSSGWVEGTMSSLFFVSGETLYMPALAAQAVQGTMQRFIVECCRREGFSLQEIAAVTWEHLGKADRVFVCNSVFGLWPVKRIMETELDAKPSQLFDHLQQKVMSLIS